MKFLTIVAFVLVSFLGTATFAQESNPCKAEALVGFSGRIVDEDYNPIQGAKVRVLGFKEFSLTDEDGFFNVDLKAQDGSQVRVVIFKTGYKTHDEYRLLGLPATISLSRSTK